MNAFLEVTALARIQEETQHRSFYYQQAPHQKSRSCNVDMDCKAAVCKPKSADPFPAPKCFTRGMKAQRSCPIPIPNPNMDLYAAHRATIGRMVAASECAEPQSTETCSWDDAPDLLLSW
jgi:hypothetical protein